MLGESVGSYEITEKLAEGGMGAVYRAKHKLLARPAAVKVLLPELSNNREIVDRFFNEAKAATAIRHAGIVEIYDFGYMENGMAYIAMELLEGESLSRRLANVGRIEERHALVLLRGIASALAAAHAKGIIHRDLKPDNIYLVPDPDVAGGERPKLLDFGIAKVAEAQRGGASAKTRTGAVLGTPTYMSPEQCRGAGEIDHRSDLYALGCILYEMLTGRPPFQGEGIGELIGAHLFLEPELPTTIIPDLATETESLVLRLLQKDPKDRIQTSQELAKLLGQGTLPPQTKVTGTMQTMAQGSVHPTGTGGRVSRTPAPVGTRKTPLPEGAGATAIGVGVSSPTPAGGRIAKLQTAVPTTLSGATGQTAAGLEPAAAEATAAEPTPVPPPKKKPVALFAGVGAALVAVIVVVVLATAGGGSGAKNNAAGPGTGSTVADPTTPTNVATPVDAGVAVTPPDVDAAQVAAPTATPIDAGAVTEPTTPTDVASTKPGSGRDGKHRDRTRTTVKPGGTTDGTQSKGSGGASAGSGSDGNFDRGD